MSFATLGLSREILQAVEDKGYTQTTQIQQSLIPAVLAGRDILAGAQTGTGKTAAFVLPILQKLSLEFQEGIHYPKALIIVPTRELAKQVKSQVSAYAKYLPLKSTVLYGGSNIRTQALNLKEGTDVVISTSGRLLEHLGQKNLSLESIDYLVLDEADTILDMGFLHEVTQILSQLPIKRQNILISATLSGPLKRLADKMLHRPKLIEVDSMGTSASTVKQIVYPVQMEKKTELLSYLIGSRNYQRVLVFVRKKEMADMIEQELNLSGLKTVAIHGDRSSGSRSRALSDFIEGKARVLVATDIAARGLDIPNLEIVINYDIPHVVQDYIHRIGRTGRAGKKGLAITLVNEKEMIALKDVERMMGKAITQERLDGYAPEILKEQKGARKSEEKKQKVDGAFGKKKKSSTATTKKRKSTKRDAFKAWDQVKTKSDEDKRSKKGRRK
ncbi:MAG: DEAD/DEAH box helicase [Campylobacterales bacterium]|nr:DEAD/DEAH box helicase [Campylobacterales bacterium]